jgi:uncharacterized protein (DUF1501 family)
MERRDFIRNTGLASLGLTFNLNGFAADFLNSSPFPILDCNAVNDRILIILRMSGANDGLNMCVPLNYYTEYANLRPTIRLKNVGQTNGLIGLDSTVADNKKVGIHPSMTGIKSLYDSGKVQLINGIGYPNHSQSHFGSENIMWAGKDGNYTGVLDEGTIGNYMNFIYPNLSGNPNGLMSDPLCLHLGSPNPIMSFAHDHSHKTIEYNGFYLQSTFNSILNKAAPSILNSDYKTKQDYIKGIEQNMDVYYNRIMNCFNSGTNSTTSYPNTDIAKQLKTIARLIKGGSKTKIFQCTIGGFDTHVGQVVAGSTNLGFHTSLLSSMSDALAAFQTDITIMGFSNKVLTTSFTEFGRKVAENGSLGTDHGNYSPMWVIGDAVNAGITGINPNLNNLASDGRYNASELQFDYRQVYIKFFQDWLGASSSVINAIGLGSFVNNSVDLIKSAQNANPTCLSNTVSSSCTDYSSMTNQLLVLKTIDSGWEYYGTEGSSLNILAIEKFPTDAGGNTNSFDIDFTYSTLDCAPNNIGCFQKTNNQEGIFASNDFFNMKVTSALQPNGFVNLRWFIPNNMVPNLTNAAQNFKTSSNANYMSPLIWLKKSKTQMKLIDHLRDDALGLYYASEKINITVSSSIDGYVYNQFNGITNINGTGIAAIMRVSNIIETNAAYNIPASDPNQKGTIHFNSITKTFEGYDGSDWIPLN